jgi:hypothetical protein
MMALIIEDGTKVADAQSYSTYDDLVAYGQLKGVTVTAVQADGEALLLEAMDMLKGRRWKGERATTTQSLEWPRTGVYCDDQLVPLQTLSGGRIACLRVDFLQTGQAGTWMV